MATLTVYTTDRSGTVDLTSIATSAAGGGDKFANSGVEMLYANNGSMGSITITMTLASTATIDGQTATSKTYVLAAGHAVLLGPFRTSWYNDTNNFMNFAYSGVTSLTVAAIKTGTN